MRQEGSWRTRQAGARSKKSEHDRNPNQQPNPTTQPNGGHKNTASRKERATNNEHTTAPFDATLMQYCNRTGKVLRYCDIAILQCRSGAIKPYGYTCTSVDAVVLRGRRQQRNNTGEDDNTSKGAANAQILPVYGTGTATWYIPVGHIDILNLPVPVCRTILEVL